MGMEYGTKEEESEGTVQSKEKEERRGQEWRLDGKEIGKP